VAPSDLRPVGLKCEYRIDPLGIGEREPRLSWELQSESRRQVQSAYRILVAGKGEDLEAEENLLWDSGRVESDSTNGVEYQGEALRSGSQCVWKVRVWDGTDDPSPYSRPAVFETGLLERSDWKGAWISAGKGPAGDMEPPSGDEYDELGHSLAPSPYLRKEFPLYKPVRRARMYATARGVYELYINGNRVGNDVLAPGWTDYDRRVQYQTYDITPLLVEGSNALGAVLGDGWFAGFVGFDPKHRGALYGPRPQFLAQLNVEYEDGTTENLATEGSWRCSAGPILYSDLLMGESYDARREMPGWAEPGFDDSGWYSVEAEEIGDTNLVAQPDEGIRVTEELEAKTVTEPESGRYVLDLGRNMVGWVRLKVEGKAGTEVILRHAQSPEGAFPDVAPLPGGSGLIDLRWGAPAWGDAGVIVPWTIYRTYDDTRIVERHYDAMARWMEHLHEANPDLIRKNRMGNNYGDWLSPKGDHTPKHLLATAYWAYGAKLIAEMAEATGRNEDAREYRDLNERIKAAFQAAYVFPDGRIEGDTQTCYLLALHMGLLPEDLRSTAAEDLVKSIEREDWHLSTGFAGVGYLCPVLTEAGYTEVAYRLLGNETYPSWGYTIKNGATTIWERWDGWTQENGFQSPNMNSFNHYSLGSVGEWLYRYVAGIDLGAPGYGRIVIRPRPGGNLTHASGTYDSVRGRISSSWKIEDNQFVLETLIPPNTTATVHLPSTDDVSECGRPVDEADGVEFLRAEEGETVLAVGSGRYEFVGKVVRG